ncbi:MAG: hypothetical protein DRJ29_10810 [Bacteroidetes bacterium]|nr:MAG: hypothetical protein DRI98_10030 [Bacteroidota bacterium]RLD92789.1 MAG: hypothetical protein DRJ29_10810 [Bacteroidota bacterium]
MKRIFIGGMLIMFTLLTMGQTSAVDKVFDKYSGKEGYTTVYISSFMFNMLNSLETDDPEFDEFKKATAGIKSIKILTQEGGNSVAFGAELLEMLPRSEYQEMMVVKDQDEDVLFLAREEGGKITEFLLIVSGGGEDVLIAIQGDIDLESISSIASGLDIPGFENLEDIEDMP